MYDIDVTVLSDCIIFLRSVLLDYQSFKEIECNHLAGVKQDGFRSVASFLFWGRVFQNSRNEIPERIAAVGTLKMQSKEKR